MTVRGNRGEAERELAAMVASVRSARAVGVRSSVSELLEAWFAVASRSTRVRDLTTVAIDDFYSQLRTDGRLDGQSLSVRRVHAVLHHALAQAMRWDWIWTNPAAAANTPAEEPTELRPPTPVQVNALLAHAAADPAFQLFLVLAATTAARRGELLALPWADIDLARGSISVQRALIEGPSGPVLAPTKTRRPHHVDLDARTLALVRARYVDTDRAVFGRVDLERFVFSADPDGAVPWRPNWVTKRFIAIRTAAGVGHFRLHDLRHFMATEMLHRLVPLPTVPGRLAHVRMFTTLNVYAHAVPSGDRLAATVIGDLVVGAPTRHPGAAPLRPSTARHALRSSRRGSRCRARPSG
jgi:integrase